MNVIRGRMRKVVPARIQRIYRLHLFGVQKTRELIGSPFQIVVGSVLGPFEAEFPRRFIGIGRLKTARVSHS